jgi:o-succinylbenzoate---CoA ligase
MTHLHAAFKINGLTIDSKKLLEKAQVYTNSALDFEKKLGAFIVEWFDENDFINLQTSGSTGKPKVIKVLKKHMIASAMATGSFFGLKQKNTVLHCLPMDYVAGKMMLVRGFVLGLDVHFVAPSSNPMAGIEKHFDFCAMVPLQVQNSLGKLQQLKKLIIGGAKVSEDLAFLVSKTPVMAYETYGMTETISHIAAKKLTDKAFTILPDISIFKNEKDCLVIDAPKIGIQKLHTNDIVEILSVNTFLWLGRLDNCINSGGIKIIPEQVMLKLAPFISRRFFVCGQKDAALGEKVVLCIEGTPYDIKPSIFKVLTKFEKPKTIFFIPKFAETPTGKIIPKESLALLELKN